MKTNERKQENKVFKFEDAQYEILKRISLYISGVDRHFELKYNNVYSNAITAILTILGTVCLDAFNKLDKPVSFVYEGKKYDEFDLVLCSIVPKGNLIKLVIFINSSITSCVITAVDDVTTYENSLHFDCRAWDENGLPLVVESIGVHDYTTIEPLICRDLSNEVRDKLGNVWASALEQMANEAVWTSLYRADMMYKDVTLVFTNFTKDKQWLTLFLTKEGLSCFIATTDNDDVVLQHDCLSHDDNADSVVSIPTIVVGCYPDDVFVNVSRAGK